MRCKIYIHSHPCGQNKSIHSRKESRCPILNWSSLSLFSSKALPLCKGKISRGEVTKVLLRDLPPGRIVVLRHRDLDEVIAQELIDQKVKAVVNCQETMSGAFPTHGPLMLLQQHIPVWEADGEAFEAFTPEAEIEIYEDRILVEGRVIPCSAFTREKWIGLQQLANEQAAKLMEQFIANTLNYAMREKDAVMKPLPHLCLETNLEGRHVLIVSRGKGYKKDLQAAKAYITEMSPILIGVDGGADALLDCGYRPDLIIGDMDSVTDRALACGAELVVHAYPDGTAPGLQRTNALGLTAHILPCFGTSEDAALLLAYEKQGEVLVTVGARTHMIDFLEKGRAGMGSTLLVRMKLGARLVDIKSIGILYKPRRWTKEALVTMLLSLFFIGLGLLQLHWILKRAAHVVWKLGGEG
ncbi:putative cytokinetic ring protein SteA [Paenibacillus sp. GCM10023248]|uniref:putative cytokinetic ring protein SteA n=1 Tax=unclassified Paenibacillus TaxID=185978 RepID=UPI002377DE2E|nr:putative cytokinetic ring protein SteA [Paenibacillus sp. MAHUQ-63]MDD9267545.1 putative cytokinetic ring protein SteA [Paenibacillus sp. MAHUQ-63]